MSRKRNNRAIAADLFSPKYTKAFVATTLGIGLLITGLTSFLYRMLPGTALTDGMVIAFALLIISAAYSRLKSLLLERPQKYLASLPSPVSSEALIILVSNDEAPMVAWEKHQNSLKALWIIHSLPDEENQKGTESEEAAHALKSVATQRGLPEDSVHLRTVNNPFDFEEVKLVLDKAVRGALSNHTADSIVLDITGFPLPASMAGLVSATEHDLSLQYVPGTTNSRGDVTGSSREIILIRPNRSTSEQADAAVLDSQPPTDARTARVSSD